MAMFDLPVMTDKERKAATRFRNDLLDDGFLMIQFSVYARPCVSFEQLSKHLAIIQKMVPEAGNVRLSYITDEQWAKSVMVIGPNYQQGSRQGTRSDWVLQVLVAYRLLDPDSEWRLYRHWFEHSAMADLLGADLELAELHKLYECHERLLEHKRELFTHLTGQWSLHSSSRSKAFRWPMKSWPATPATRRR